VILINKVDLVSPEELAKIEGVVRMLNPGARIHKTVRSNVALKDIFNTQLFDFDKAATAPGWLQEMRGTHVPETVEYGITSFLYRARRPFHPQRFYDLLFKPGSKLLDNVWRSKGFVWCGLFHAYLLTPSLISFSFRIASRDRYVAEFEKAGLLIELDGADLWFVVRFLFSFPFTLLLFWLTSLRCVRRSHRKSGRKIVRWS